MAEELKRLGSCLSKTTSEEREARRRSREIDVMLKRTAQKPVVILLCGGPKSGKSTFLKQMRIIQGGELSQEELLGYRPAVYRCIIKGMQGLVEQKKRMGIPWEDAANEKHEKFLESAYCRNMHLEPQTFQPFINAINSLWKDAGIQETYSKYVQIFLQETKEFLKYFLHNIHRISQLSYIPCHLDFLYLSEPKMELYIHQNIMIHTYNHMKRWYEPANLVLFMADSNEFDRVFLEDDQSWEDTSLIYSLKIFHRAINHRWCCKRTMILFLNKTDLLAEKVKTADIRRNFPEFRGDPHSLEEVQEFLVQSFRAIMGNDRRPFYHHFTTAVDTENIRIAFNIVKDIIMQKNLIHFKQL